MKSAPQRFSNVLKEGITPILKENGFKKKGQKVKKFINGVFQRNILMVSVTIITTHNLSGFPKALPYKKIS